jgi:hypothetical protein
MQCLHIPCLDAANYVYNQCILRRSAAYLFIRHRVLGLVHADSRVLGKCLPSRGDV